MQVRALSGVIDSGGTAGGSNVWVVGQRLHHRKDGAVLQERQFASAEVIQQRAKRFGPHGHLRVQPPRVIGIELARAGLLRGSAHNQ
jgi:hypothetical protein